jgi:hypothetical protein
VPDTIALFSDTHGNTPGLRAVLDDISRAGCTRAYMLGDLINGVDPHGCIQLLREWADTEHVELACLKGNGEEYLLTPDRGALPQHDEDWNLDMIQLTAWWEAHLTPDDLAWIATFQDYIRWDGSAPDWISSGGPRAAFLGNWLHSNHFITCAHPLT